MTHVTDWWPHSLHPDLALNFSTELEAVAIGAHSRLDKVTQPPLQSLEWLSPRRVAVWP